MMCLIVIFLIYTMIQKFVSVNLNAFVSENMIRYFV